jgi:hypothetical protein
MKNGSFRDELFNQLLAHFYFHGQGYVFSIVHNVNIIYKFAVEKLQRFLKSLIL